MKYNDIRAKMEKLNTYIIDAEISVRGGKMVEMGHLDRDIGDLCTRAVSLPPLEARELQPLMAEMIGNLERLGHTLKDYRDNLRH